MKRATRSELIFLAMGIIWLCPLIAAADPVDPGDAAIGLSVSDVDDTIELVGPGGVLEADSWNNFGFVQSVEFDNSGGNLHSSSGNLIGVNFGSSGTGGSLYQYPAPNTGAGTAMIEAGTANDTLAVIGTTTRLVGAGVSGDNQRISVMDWDLGEISVLNYNAAAGTVSLFGNTSGSLLQSGETQGTAWIGSSSVESMSSIGDVLSYAAVAGLPESFRLNVSSVVAVTGEMVPTFDDAVTDAEYNPNIADVLVMSAGIFSGGMTTNYIFAINPNTNVLLDIVDLSLSATTLREIAWTPEGDLIVSQFAGGGGTVLDILPNFAAQIGTFPDNGSLDYYTTAVSSSFNGVDVAFIPEPASATLLALGGLMLMWIGRSHRD